VASPRGECGYTARILTTLELANWDERPRRDDHRIDHPERLAGPRATECRFGRPAPAHGGFGLLAVRVSARATAPGSSDAARRTRLGRIRVLPHEARRDSAAYVSRTIAQDTRSRALKSAAMARLAKLRSPAEPLMPRTGTFADTSSINRAR